MLAGLATLALAEAAGHGRGAALSPVHLRGGQRDSVRGGKPSGIGLHAKRSGRTALLAYAPTGRSGDFAATKNPSEEEDAAETLALAAGLGWLYGLGCVVGPFFGVGVGFVFPVGIIAGAGGGVGVVVGIGMGGGAVWGSGRGDVNGFKVGVPMAPPKVPELAELIDGARGGVAALRGVRGLARERMRELVRRREVPEESS